MPEENKSMPDKKEMRRTGIKISICMSLTISLVLSFVGTFTSGHFTVRSFLFSFALSTVVSLIIGFIVPIGRVTMAASGKAGQKPGSFGAKCIESFVSDLIYTPLITFLMVFMAYKNAVAMGAPVVFSKMFFPSLIICFVTGFIVIFIFQPIYFNLFTRGKR